MSVITTSVLVQVPVSLAYRAFTNSTSLREWLCDVASVSPRPGGRMYLWWTGDFFSSGQYLELVENRSVRFRWYSSVDPAPTEVFVTLETQGTGTRIRLDHEVPDDPAWARSAGMFRENWGSSLENLQSVLETGIDLRLANRPLLGIVPSDFTPEQAAALGVPVTQGLRLSSVVDGMGAQKAGLKADDVIVEMAGHPIGSDAFSLPDAIAGKKGGDVIDVVFYRGAERRTVAMELSRRPMPQVPFDPLELAARARVIYRAGLAEVKGCFAQATDEQALAHPLEGEWSALEIIAHLIHGERFLQVQLTGLIDGFEPVSDGFGSNVTAQVQATVAAHPTIERMLETLESSVEETLAYVERIPEEFTRRKGSYYRFAAGLVQPNYHLTDHLQQITDTLAAARR